ncbi:MULTISPECIES: PIG-L deacetylase family protein [Streptomyces]|uniref:PIG-L family deacetylase n=1 Tax=Streptomyces solicathayae TaxID=3081768 RepID=A0ABZ0LNX8_9ACTN|nr:PIG-L family deacetylase [Streptomyces sp. HUAS YS2]WOX20931.1 PIG-L family deacetylase [Streptomyces sp. HUAS YS2]
MATDRLTAEIEARTRLVVLSPHLDDAVLSCGALLARLRPRTPVTVATLFTHSGPPPHTLSARRYLRQTRASDAERLYASRRDEDRAVLDRLGVSWQHAGLPDGLFRRRQRQGAGRRALARGVPELDHVYPTYRLHLSAGRISDQDAGTVRQVADVLSELTAPGHALVLAPLAVGGHVDHLLVRTVAERSRQRVVYYSDFPYNQEYDVDPAFTRRHALVRCDWESGLDDKAELIRGYRSQADALFPRGSIPRAPEVYLLPDESAGATP